MGAQSQYEIVIETKADPTELEKEKAALDAVAESAEKATEALAANPSGANDYSVQLEREASLREEMAASATQISEQEQQQLATEQRKQALLSQRQAIIEQELEAIAAEAAGDTERAAALDEDIAVRKEALTIQKQTTLAEEEAMALAQQRISAERLITAQEQAQAALNAELIAQEEAKLAAAQAQSKVSGDGGKLSAALKNVGVDNGLATTIGIAVLAGVELNRQFTEMARAYDAARTTAEAQSVEYAKQVEQWKEMASSAKDMADVVKVTESVNKSLDNMLEKFRSVKSEGTTGGFFDQLIDHGKTWINLLSDANREMLVNTGQISAATAEALRQQQHLQTSTEEAQEAISDQLATAAKAGQVYEDLAQRQADWFKALESKTPSEQIALLVEKERELITAQEGVDRSSTAGQQRWAAYQKQIDDVVKAEGKAMEAQQKAADDAEKAEKQQQKAIQDTIDKIKEKADALGITLKLPKPTTATSADEAQLAQLTAQRDAQTDPQSWTNFDAMVQAAQKKIQGSLQAQLDAQEKALGESKARENGGAGANAPAKQEPLTDSDLDTKNQGGEAQLDDFEKTLRDRDTASKLQDAGETLGSDVAPKLDEGGTKLQDAGKAISEATDGFATAADVLGDVPQHFEAITNAIAPLPDAIADAAAPIPDQITQLGATTQAGFSAISAAVAAANTNLQQQINTLASQIAMMSV